MNFTSPAFVLCFPLVLALHWLLPARARWALLLAASVGFYAVGSLQALPLLAAVTFGTYIAALGIAKAQTARAKRLWCAGAAVLCMGCLAVFKYGGFAAGMFGGGAAASLILPAGISFYTFQTLSYVIDVYRGQLEAEKHFGYYALFVCFFPQLVAGPIERSGSLLPQLRKEDRTPDIQGALWLLRGFAKKLLVADAAAAFVDEVYAAPAQAAGPAAVLATALFAVQIYYDFSGYSDIAVGAAALLGVRLCQNFDEPYSSCSLREFWRRWHISLNTWLTDYLYIPLGGSRRGLARQCVNMLAVFLASGLWHGAAWHYVAWGAYHGVLCVAETLLRRKSALRPPRWAARAATVALVGAGWVFFRAQSVGEAFTMFSRAFTGWSLGGVSGVLAALGAGTAAQILLGVLCLKLLPVPCGGKKQSPAYPQAALLLALAVLLVWLNSLNGEQAAFLYFQF